MPWEEVIPKGIMEWFTGFVAMEKFLLLIVVTR